MQKKLLKLAVEKLGPELIDIAKEHLGKKTSARPSTSPASSSSSRPSSPSSQQQESENTAHTNLAPIAPQHATSRPTDLYLKEKAFGFTGDNASVKDSKGNTMFSIRSELLTISQRRSLVDANGNVIAQLRRQKMGIIPTIYIGTPSNEKKVVVKTTGILNPLNCNASLTINGRRVGKIEGNWRAKKFTIKIDGEVIAKIGRKRTIASTFVGADSYNIHVTPPQGNGNKQSVDLAFVSLICIALDELYHDK